MDYNRFNRPPYQMDGYGNRGPGGDYRMPPYGDMSREWHGMPYYRPMPGMGQGLPYHMAHPYPMYMQEEDDEKDFERLQSMMPVAARLVQPLVEEECDRMEYDGSLMFDEYPDKVMMEQMVNRIYQEVQKVQGQQEEEQEEGNGIFATVCRGCKDGKFGEGLSDLIKVMLFEEMHRRRCRHRRCKRWW